MGFIKHFIILFVFFSITETVYSQTAPPIQWQKSYGGSGKEQANCIKNTTDGGYIVVGYSTSINGNISGNHGQADVWIVKIASTGSIQWQKCLGGSNYDVAYSIAQTTDGGYIVAGGTSSTDGDVTGKHAVTDAWLIKLTNTGIIQWQKCYGGSKDDRADVVIQTIDGGYIFAGFTYSSDGDVSGYHFGPFLTQDFFIVKVNSTGTIQWQKTLGGSEVDYANSIQQTSDGGYIVAGLSYSANGDISFHHGSIFNPDCWIIKLSANGDITWQKTIGGALGDAAWDIQKTSDGGYVFSGSSDSKDGDVNQNKGSSDVLIIKLDATGNIQWQKTYGGSSSELSNSINQTADGGYIVCGQSFSEDFDVRGKYGIGNYNSDGWLLKLDSFGVLQWQKCLGGMSNDYLTSSQITADGGIVLTGYSSSVDGDLTANFGDEDFWIIKLAPEIVPPCTASVTVAVKSTSICQNDVVTFNAIITNGGNSPQYQWKVNGNNVGVSNLQFSSSTLTNGDIITCELTSNATCATVAKVTSNSIIITINPLPKINIVGDSCLGSTLKVISDLPIDSIRWQLNNNTTVSIKNAGYANVGVTVAGGNGSGSASNQLISPDRIFVDSVGTMYIPDLGNNRVIKWLAGASFGTVVAGGNGAGFASNQLDRPTGLFVDKGGNIFIADQSNGRIQKWIPGSTNGITVAGSGLNGYLNGPTAVFVDAIGNIYVSEQYASKVTKFIAGTTVPITVAGGNGYGSAANQLSAPTGIYVDAKGNVFVCDTDNDRVTMWIPGATSGVTVAGGNGYGSGANQLANPLSVFVDVSGNLIISDFNNFRVQKWASNATSGVTIAGGNGRGNASNQFNQPIGAFLTSNNDLYVADFYNNRVQKFAFNLNDTYKPVVEGSYTATVTSASGCSVISSPIIIVSNKVPTVSISASASNICPNKPISFTAIPTYGGTAPSYQWKINGINVGTDTAVFTTSLLQDGDIVSCVMKSNSTQCLVSPNAVSNALTMQKKILPQLLDIEGNNIVCLNSTIILKNATLGGTWGSLSPAIASIDSLGTVKGISTGKTSIFYTITDGCTVQTKTFEISVAPLPSIQNIDVTYELCDNHLGTINIKGSSANYFSINGGSFQSTPTFSSLVPGLYKIMAKDTNSCILSTDVVVDKIITPKPQINIVSSNTTCFRPQLGSISINISGLEQPYAFIFNGKKYITSASFTNLTAGSYFFSIYNKNDCLVDSIIKDVLLTDDGTCDTLYIPSAFTPNNDGRNDIMRPIGGALVKDIIFKIFNRFGNIVYEGHDAYNGWNGKVNGILQDGNTVYVWYITYTDRTGKMKMNKGTTVLLR